MASTHPAPQPDRNGRFALAAMTFGTVAMVVWLVVSLALAAF